MGEPVFFLQIVDREGKVANLPGGGALEAALVDLMVKHIMPKGVGVFRTSNHVEQDIRDGIHDAIMSLKLKTFKLIQ